MPDKLKDSAIIQISISQAHKELIERAALTLGQSIDNFAVTTLVSRTRQVVETNAITQLSDGDRDPFMVILDDDTPPNSALRKAAKR